MSGERRESMRRDGRTSSQVLGELVEDQGVQSGDCLPPRSVVGIDECEVIRPLEQDCGRSIAGSSSRGHKFDRHANGDTLVEVAVDVHVRDPKRNVQARGGFFIVGRDLGR